MTGQYRIIKLVEFALPPKRPRGVGIPRGQAVADGGFRPGDNPEGRPNTSAQKNEMVPHGQREVERRGR
jgi:hypothetical protein